MLVDLCTSVLWFGCYCISFVSLLRGLVWIRVGGGVSGWFVFGGLLVVDFVGVLRRDGCGLRVVCGCALLGGWFEFRFGLMVWRSGLGFVVGLIAGLGAVSCLVVLRIIEFFGCLGLVMFRVGLGCGLCIGCFG